MRHHQRKVHSGHRLRLLAAACSLASASALLPAAAGVAAPADEPPQAPANSIGQPDLGGGLTAPDLTDAQRRDLAAQQPYLRLDEQVRQFAGQLSGGRPEASPLAGVKLDRAAGKVYVYWAGSTPGGLELIQRAASRAGVSLVVQRAVFSERQLMKAADAIGAYAETTGTRLAVDLAIDGSGLTLKGAAGLRSAELNRATASQAEQGLFAAVDEVRSRTGVPVTVSDEPLTPTTPATRDSDFSPYWAGAHTIAGGLGCTSGFSMYATGAPTRFMMTAAHCSGFRDGVAVTNGTGQRMGVTDFIHELFDVTSRYDLGVISLDSGLSNQNRMYLNETTDGGAFVRGYASGGVPAGGNYCVSGAVSTPNCRIMSGAQTLLCAGWIPFGRCIYAITFTSTGGTTHCQGDSGGPIYYWNSAGTVAAGVVSFGYGSGPCWTSGGMSVVATAVNTISGLRVVTG